jgi:hypothetical protein
MHKKSLNSHKLAAQLWCDTLANFPKELCYNCSQADPAPLIRQPPIAIPASVYILYWHVDDAACLGPYDQT